MTITPASVDDDDVVQVYILMGQSNMLGMGTIGDGANDTKDGTLSYACYTKGLYPYLLEDGGAAAAATQKNQWATREDVRYVFTMGGGTDKAKLQHNEWLTVKGSRIGPEIGIGHVVGDQTEGAAPVLLLKSCIGNRSLGWDLLPPGSKEYEYTDQKDGITYVYAGYKESPMRWEKGKPKPDPINWYAGKQYDGDVRRIKEVLADLPTYVPGGFSKYKISGFFWWQGDKDSRCEGLAEYYESHLVHFIRQLRIEFDAPEAKFVCATLGQTCRETCDHHSCCGKIFDAMMHVSCGQCYPEFEGNVATVYSHPLSKGGSSGGHYNHNAETYMNVGEAMGHAMVGLSTKRTKATPNACASRGSNTSAL